MHCLKRITASPLITNKFHKLSSAIPELRGLSSKPSSSASSNSRKAQEEWNESWETAWLPEDLSAKHRSPWETDVNFPSPASGIVLSSEVDAETKAFVEDMNENWNQRKGSKTKQQEKQQIEGNSSNGMLYSLDNVKKDYRLMKQRIHAGLWVKEIEKQEEAKLGDPVAGGGDDIEKLLDSCSEIFDTSNNELNNSKIPSSNELKNKPDGWETTAKAQDGNVWEMSQREEDILLQEFDRRIAYSKFRIASFIKTHIFSRRRPIDGWKYMIEELGPNAKKGKGSVSRLPSLSDASTQPFKEERNPFDSRLTPLKGR
ncbi:protein GAMETE CELL DEFECTIVE 1, mitochondrial [Juglans microcarpa x Juglans regia]|uniref:protein GAMETE CELL DEFECTIVE 1, mitochondrial n=1 Tax=Juglans microcarpa x Juglans regia TaxID=2249226 RepID=UPI001B7F170B|nr:protein GAMETE CELL DEFECTIVE 1, mitochondrial [Juglans microcarpa x Juglans regia]